MVDDVVHVPAEEVLRRIVAEHPQGRPVDEGAEALPVDAVDAVVQPFDEGQVAGMPRPEVRLRPVVARHDRTFLRGALAMAAGVHVDLCPLGPSRPRPALGHDTSRDIAATLCSQESVADSRMVPPMPETLWTRRGSRLPKPGQRRSASGSAFER